MFLQCVGLRRNKSMSFKAAFIFVIVVVVVVVFFFWLPL